MALNVALYTLSAVTIGATEYSIVNNSTTIATVSTPYVIQVVAYSSAMAAGDEFEIALQEKLLSGGTQRRIVLANLVGAQSEPFWTDSYFVGVGWDVTLKKIAGTDRAWDASIRSVS